MKEMVAMGLQARPTCLAGLDLALKWVGRGSDPEVARCTAAVALGCGQRHDCLSRDECSERLHAIEALLEHLPPRGSGHRTPPPKVL
ncbi:MAG: hypothetical protein EPN20_02740 [Magnetospirillum sp.]|nr:MAG: hypothetical protein EPN20_02740 [Magnetospirillum sp.]